MLYSFLTILRLQSSQCSNAINCSLKTQCSVYSSLTDQYGEHPDLEIMTSRRRICAVSRKGYRNDHGQRLALRPDRCLACNSLAPVAASSRWTAASPGPLCLPTPALAVHLGYTHIPLGLARAAPPCLFAALPLHLLPGTPRIAPRRHSLVQQRPSSQIGVVGPTFTSDTTRAPTPRICFGQFLFEFC